MADDSGSEGQGQSGMSLAKVKRAAKSVRSDPDPEFEVLAHMGKQARLRGYYTPGGVLIDMSVEEQPSDDPLRLEHGKSSPGGNAKRVF
jgi:hypothetical protein